MAKLTDNKEKVIHVRVTADMFNTLVLVAEYNGMSVSSYVRMALDYVVNDLYRGSAHGSKE